MENSHEPLSRSDPGALPPSSRGFARDVVHEVGSILARSGALRALQFLNARTRFRYTGIYRIEPPNLRNLYLTDRENPTLNVSGKVCPLDETYCGITCAQESPFSTPDARRDERLVAHPARESVLSYGGVPLRATTGRAWGTLCHFDLRPRLLPASELTVLQEAAPLFVEWLRRHGTLS